jgi:flagellar biogenesis protein FliO
MIDARRSAAWNRTTMRWSGFARAMTGRRLAVAFVVGAVAIVWFVGTIHPSTAGGAQTAVSGVGTDWGAGGAADGFNVIDLVTKGALVLILLFVTLRLLGRAQGTVAKKGSRMVVLESRTIASKASLHLVAIGGRRLVVGLTPSGMVSLAELDATELEDAEPSIAATPADQPSVGLDGIPAPVSPIDALLAPLDRLGARLFALLGAGKAR